MKEKSVSFFFLKLKAKEKANFSKVIWGEGDEHEIRGFELVIRGLELVTRGFELVIYGFELALLNFNSCF